MHRLMCSSAGNIALCHYKSKRRARFCAECCDLGFRSPQSERRRGDSKGEYNKKSGAEAPHLLLRVEHKCAGPFMALPLPFGSPHYQPRLFHGWVRLCSSPGYYNPRMVIRTRRFNWRPSAVSLLATGSAFPCHMVTNSSSALVGVRGCAVSIAYFFIK
jgi:hypothetical protein